MSDRSKSRETAKRSTQPQAGARVLSDDAAAQQVAERYAADFPADDIVGGFDYDKPDNFKVPFKREHYRHKCVAEEKVERHKRQGFILDPGANETNPVPGMVWMCLHDDRHKKRQEFMERQNKLNEQSADEPAKVSPTAFRRSMNARER